MKVQTKALLITIAFIIIPILFVFRGTIIFWYENLSLPETHEAKEQPVAKRKKNASIGKVIDSFNGVKVYYNGRVRNVSGRNLTKDGYNLGLKYQCVEFVKRYYYQRFGHKMPDSYGHAKDFFDQATPDGGLNKSRALRQYTNPSSTKPLKEALLIYGPTQFNAFGHVAIITDVSSNSVSCISQNLGSGNGTRRTYPLRKTNANEWEIVDPYIVGWLSR